MVWNLCTFVIEYRFETAHCYKHIVFIVHLSFVIFNQPIFYIILGSSKSQPECGPTLTRRMDRRTWWGNRSQILCKRKKGSQNVGAVSWMWSFKIEISFLICFFCLDLVLGLRLQEQCLECHHQIIVALRQLSVDLHQVHCLLESHHLVCHHQIIVALRQLSVDLHQARRLLESHHLVCHHQALIDLLPTFHLLGLHHPVCLHHRPFHSLHQTFLVSLNRI